MHESHVSRRTILGAASAGTAAIGTSTLFGAPAQAGSGGRDRVRAGRSACSSARCATS